VKSSSPPALVFTSSSAALTNERPKSLGVRHDSNLLAAEKRNSPPKSHSLREKTHQFDSANLVAAKKLYSLREEAGLTQDELAALSGESRKQVARRESNKVHLGALRALVVLERARGVKAK
jgi:DNA-binding XRE family transcriptional regulator